MTDKLNINNSSYWMHKKPQISKNNAHFGNGKKEKKDPLQEYPMRLAAYTNEVGAALSPLPVIGTKLFALSWVPALLYFGADIYDKYAKGRENDYSAPSRRNAVQQATFQALASVVLPTAAVFLGQDVASRIYARTSKDKLDVRVKEEIIEELKRDINQNKLRKFRKEFDEILAKNQNASIDEILQLDSVKEIKKNFARDMFNDIKSESDFIKHQKKTSNIFTKIRNIFRHSDKDCKNISKVPSDIFESKIMPYLEKQVERAVDTRIRLQRALNADGTVNKYAVEVDPKLLKKAQKILKDNIRNRNISDKNNFVIKETITRMMNKHSFRLSSIKIAGGFIALGLLAKPIDKFVEHVVISKFVAPKLDKLAGFKKYDDFLNKQNQS